jgi:hypothetical protein
LWLKIDEELLFKNQDPSLFAYFEMIAWMCQFAIEKMLVSFVKHFKNLFLFQDWEELLLPGLLPATVPLLPCPG